MASLGSLDVYEEPFEVEKVIDKKKVNGKLFYFVKWRGWEPSTNTWEPIYHFRDCMECLDAYEDSVRPPPILHRETQVRKQSRTARPSDRLRAKRNRAKMTKTPLEVKRAKKSTKSPTSSQNKNSVQRKDQRTSRQIKNDEKVKKTHRMSIRGQEPVASTSKNNKNQSRASTSSASSELEEEEEGNYRVEKIKKRKMKDGQEFYLIKWLGDDKESDDTWEPAEKFKDFTELLQEFEKEQKKGKIDKKRRRSSRNDPPSSKKCS